MDGRPLEVRPGSESSPAFRVEISLFKEGDLISPVSIVDAGNDGLFLFSGIAPGKYRLTVRHHGATPRKNAPTDILGGGSDETDHLRGAFTEQNSRITVTVKEGESTVELGTIDLKDPATHNKP